VAFLQSNWILAFVFAFALFGSGKLEGQDGVRNGLLWAGLSIAISVLVIQFCGGGWLFELLTQLGLFVGIGAVRAIRDTRKAAKRR
jgi:hypothetical protein